MDEYLRYERSKRLGIDDNRNGYKPKEVTGNFGKLNIQVPQDRTSTFEPKHIKERQSTPNE